MNQTRNYTNLTGWIVFAIAMTVYFFSAERTGSLWDCGEFILGAYKMQVVHPPGAPLFILIGRMFAWVGSLFGEPSNIAFMVNLMSGVCTAFAAMFITWITIYFTKLAVYRRGDDNDNNTNLAIYGGGLVAGLASAFCITTWFSAVEGEVYAMSTMFSVMTFWAGAKWYMLPDEPKNDKWLIFGMYAAGLSIGVHLLSLLCLPPLALLYYYKRYKNHNLRGVLISLLVGFFLIFLIQKVIIIGIPSLWSTFELMMVNGLGLPFHTGVIPTVLTLAAICYFGLNYTKKRGYDLLHKVVFTFMLLVVSYSVVGIVLIRANANPPINMNHPDDVMRLLPYLNREQYGDRSLLKGPTYEARPIDTKSEDRYGRVGDQYEVVDKKLEYVYNPKDEILFPRISHGDMGRPGLYKQWMQYLQNKTGKPNTAFNFLFFWKYQVQWMYWRYFFWNFAGRESGEQGFYPWNLKDGNWQSGVSFVDNARLYDSSKEPEHRKDDQARNHYYFIPFILGLLGIFWHFKKDRGDFLALLLLFLVTGLFLIIYSNSPPNEPRERDYVLVLSFMTFCVWIGMSVVSIYQFLSTKISGIAAPVLVTAIGLAAPALMLKENFDDMSRNHIYASRDYAKNILESCEKNAIIFTYGDNDTYPVWYAQEVENVRRDVRVINLSLIAVDWYIDQQRRKINESEPVKLSIPSAAYRGMKRNQVFHYNPSQVDREMSVTEALKFIGEDHPLDAGGGRTLETFLPSKLLYIPMDREKSIQNGSIAATDTSFIPRIPINISSQYVTKDEIAILDIISSNINDRPVYFSVTCHDEKLFGMNDYTNQEGMALRIVPRKSPSDQNMYIYGSGKCDVEKGYDIITKKFAWGNFDKKKLFVDHSYAPSIQAMRMIMMRTAGTLMQQGENKRAADIADKYFEGFPDMNFTYDARIFPFINVYIQAKEYEKAKQHMRILAKNVVGDLTFLNSLSQKEIAGGFQQDMGFAQNAMGDIMERSKMLEDPAFATEMENMFKSFATTPARN